MCVVLRILGFIGVARKNSEGREKFWGGAKFFIPVLQSLGKMGYPGTVSSSIGLILAILEL